MSLYFKQSNRAAAAEAFASVHGGNVKPAESYFDATQSKLYEVRLAMRGGQECAEKFLIFKKGESLISRRARINAYENVNLMRAVIEAMADMDYGKSPMREAFFGGERETDASKALNHEFKDVYEQERFETATRLRLAPKVLRDNSGTVKTWFDESERRIRLSFLPKEYVLYVYDPMDCDSTLAAVELRRSGNVWHRYLWTTDEVGYIGPDWEWVAGPDGTHVENHANPTPGLTQYIRFGFDHPQDEGESFVWDLLLSQKAQTNLRSQVGMGVRSQLLATPVVNGKIKNKKQQGDGGEEFIYFSADKPLILEDGGQFAYASPGFDPAKVNEYELGRIEHYLEWYGVPAMMANSAKAPEKPMALAIKMYRALRERNRHLCSFRDSEKQLADSILGLAAYHETWPELHVGNLDTVDVEINFPEDILPSDRIAGRQQDATEVKDGLRSRSRFIKAWVVPDGSDEEVKAEENAIDARGAAQDAAVANAVANAAGRRAPAGPPQSAADALIQSVAAGRDAVVGSAR